MAKCETEKILNNIGAYKGSCPWIDVCVKNLPGDVCELALSCEAQDKSKLTKITIISPSQVQNLKRES